MKQKSKKRSYLTLPYGIRVVRRSFYTGLALFVGIIIALSSLSGLSIYLQRSQVEIPPVNHTASDRAASSDPVVQQDTVTLESILKMHRAKAGLLNTEGILLNGSYIEDGRRFTLTLASKSPNLVRKTLTDNRMDFVCSYNGTDGYIKAKHADGSETGDTLTDPIPLEMIRLEGALLALTDSAAEEGTYYRREANQDYKGKSCWIILSQTQMNPAITHVIDPDSALELARYSTYHKDGKAFQFAIQYTDFRTADGYTRPYIYQLGINGELRGHAEIESIQTNPGLTSWMFD